MSIRFAAADHRLRTRMPRALARRFSLGGAANDNAAGSAGLLAERYRYAALRLFAQHGVEAADQARRQAVAARRGGDARGYRWWLEVCRALDGAMASRLDELARLA
ncbi:hypothetical protein EG799_02960 [Aurantiacibacter spongiae]|uniref:Uncharacterized protein n=2 Tax=Aurantiacibacter spongiae TaxID=2488860 RepID=A0A3N5DG92_9SPHN|nr:hypothetical protein EG799_02960 [Aurantiacibacter spongiae]